MSTIGDINSSISLESFLHRIKLLSDYLRSSGIDPENVAILKRSNKSGYKTKGKLPSFASLQELAIDYNVSVDWLLTGEGEMLRGVKTQPSAAKDNQEVVNLLREKSRMSDELLVLNNELRELRAELDATRKAAAGENFEEGPACGANCAAPLLPRETE